jgi:hypothetical protein
MKISGTWSGVALLLVSLAYASAQVTVEVTQEQQQFVSGEALKVAVRVTNLSGQTLHIGAEADWLTFEIASRDGVVVPKLADAPVTGEFTLESSKVGIKRLNLEPYFALTQPGSYQVVATVHLTGWKRELTSAPKTFDVIQGVKLWEKEVGVPKSGETGAEPEVRRYILQQANYYRGQMRLYVRVTDGYGKPISVMPIGPIVSFGRPERQVDRGSSLHVLFQEGASAFNYTVCNLAGEITTHQTYDYTDTRPRLRADDDGNITVYGGTRRVTPTDFPPPLDDADATNSPAGPQLGATSPAK